MSKKVGQNTKVNLPEAVSHGKHRYLANIEWGTKRWEAKQAETWNKGRSLGAEEVKKAREEYEANLKKKLAGGVEGPAPAKKSYTFVPPKKITKAHQNAKNLGYVWVYDGLVF